VKFFGRKAEDKAGEGGCMTFANKSFVGQVRSWLEINRDKRIVALLHGPSYSLCQLKAIELLRDLMAIAYLPMVLVGPSFSLPCASRPLALLPQQLKVRLEQRELEFHLSGRWSHSGPIIQFFCPALGGQSQNFTTQEKHHLFTMIASGICSLEVLKHLQIPVSHFCLYGEETVFAALAFLQSLHEKTYLIRSKTHISAKELTQVQQMFSLLLASRTERCFPQTDFTAFLGRDNFLTRAAITLGGELFSDEISLSLLADRLTVRDNGGTTEAELSESLSHDLRIAWPLAEVFDRFCPDWREDPEMIMGLQWNRNDPKLLQALQAARQASKDRLLRELHFSADGFLIGIPHDFAGRETLEQAGLTLVVAQPGREDLVAAGVDLWLAETNLYREPLDKLARIAVANGTPVVGSEVGVLGLLRKVAELRANPALALHETFEALIAFDRHPETEALLHRRYDGPWLSGVGREEKRPLQIKVPWIKLVEYFNSALDGAGSIAETEMTLAEQVIKSLGVSRVTRYDVSNNFLLGAQGNWSLDADGTVFYQSDLEEISHLVGWHDLAELSGEVLGYLLLQRWTQVVADTETDPRCRCNRREPFIAVPEVVDGAVIGVIKFDFPQELLITDRDLRAFLEKIVGNAARAKARIFAKELAESFARYETAEDVMRWAVALMSSGGFPNMPHWSEISNRVAGFLFTRGGGVFPVAVGEIDNEVFYQKFPAIGVELHQKNIFESLSENLPEGSPLEVELLEKVRTKRELGGLFPPFAVTVHEGSLIYDVPEELRQRWPQARVAKAMANFQRVFKVDGRVVESSQYIPMLWRGRVVGFFYRDNPFWRDPLPNGSQNELPLYSGKSEAIVVAAAERLFEMRLPARS